jgi:hypothetical protein
MRIYRVKKHATQISKNKRNMKMLTRQGKKTNLVNKTTEQRENKPEKPPNRHQRRNEEPQA